MEFDEIQKHNATVKRNYREKCLHKELGDIRVIYKRCRECGKLIPVRDEDYIKKHGEPGKGTNFIR